MQPVPCPASLHEEKTAVVAACLHGVAPQHIVDRACNQRRVLGIAIALVKTFALLKNIDRSVLGNHIIIQPYWKHVSREFLLDAHPMLALGARVPSGCLFMHRPNTLPQCTSHCAFIVHATLATLASTGCLLVLWAIHRACICSRELHCCNI